MNRLSIALLLALAAACSDRVAPTGPSAAATALMVKAYDDPTFTTIDMPGAGGTLALDINSEGTIVGRYFVGTRTHGFIQTTRGELSTIDFPGSSFTVAAGINNRGDIVGMYSLPTSPTVRHGYLLRDGEFTSFDPPGSNFTNALGINDRGDIVGRFCALARCRAPGNGDYRGFLIRDGELSIIDVPGAHETNAFKINDREQIVGGYGSAEGGEVIFSLRKGEFAPMPLPNGAAISQDNGGINSRGDIVGLYCDGAPPCLIVPTGTHGFLMRGGDFTTIDVPGAAATSAIGINERGDVVGGYFDRAGTIHGFLMSRR